MNQRMFGRVSAANTGATNSNNATKRPGIFFMGDPKIPLTRRLANLPIIPPSRKNCHSEGLPWREPKNLAGRRQKRAIAPSRFFARALGP
jgi:hypothetical protein